MSKLITFLTFLISFFAAVDGLRDTFIPGSFISYGKEISIFLLFFFLLYDRVLYKKEILNDDFIHYLFWFTFLIQTAFVTFYFYDVSFIRGEELGFGGWSVWLKVFFGFLLMQAFSWLKDYESSRIFLKIPQYFLVGVIFYSLITLFFILTGLADNLVQRDWQGRLSIGYPTLDSFVLISGCLFLLFFSKGYTSVLITVLFFVLLIMQNTISGYLMFFIYLFGLYFFIPRNWRMLPVILLVASVAFMIFAYYFILQEMGVFGALIIDKINGLFFGGDTSSTSLRQEQIEHLKRIIFSDWWTAFFGLGGEAAFLTESNVFATFGFGGFFGLFLSSFIFSRVLWRGVSSSFKGFVFFGLSIYVVGSISLISLYLFPFIFFFAFIYAISGFPERFQKNE